MGCLQIALDGLTPASQDRIASLFVECLRRKVLERSDEGRDPLSPSAQTRNAWNGEDEEGTFDLFGRDRSPSSQTLTNED
jgi:hypothetical protein